MMRGILVLAMFCLWASPLHAQGADADDPILVELGLGVYGEHCASCHGVDLEGQANWRQRKADGRLPAPPHDATGHTWHHPDSVLFDMTKLGPAELVPNYESDMPGFGDTLSDDEIWAVLAYIKSTWPAPIRKRHRSINKRSE